MKQLLIAIAMVLSLSMNADAAAQKHRHTPRTEQADSTKNHQNAIEAFSDTTAASEDAEDDQYISYRRGATYSRSDVAEAKEVLDSVGGLLDSGLIIAIVAIVVIFLIAPLLIIFLIFYFVNRNRRERYKLAQMAMQNGQPIPDDMLKGNQNMAAVDANDYTSGLRQIFLGIGLAIFLGILVGKIGFGIGALVFFIGLGKVVIAKKSGFTGNDPLNDNYQQVDNYNNPSNNINNE